MPRRPRWLKNFKIQEPIVSIIPQIYEETYLGAFERLDLPYRKYWYEWGFIALFNLDNHQITLAGFKEPDLDRLAWSINHEYTHFILKRDFGIEVSLNFDTLRYKHQELLPIV